MSDSTADIHPPRHFDPYRLDPAAVAAPPPTLGTALRQIGPGLILAASIVGTGELIATTNLGAQVGFALLWLVILSCFIKVFVQIELGRHAISSGQTTLASLRDLPGPGLLVGWWWLIMMLFTQLQLAAMIGAIGQCLHMAIPSASTELARAIEPQSAALAAAIAKQPALPWAVAGAIVTAILLALGGYRLVERGSLIMVGLFTALTVACVALLPWSGHPLEVSQLADGLRFTLPAGAAVAALAMFGITGVGATELVSYPYWCIEKGYARFSGPNDGSDAWLARARGWMRVLRLDAWLSMVVYTVATLAFYILGAATLHHINPQGLPRSVADMLNTLAAMYVPVMGTSAALIFIIIGAFIVLYSTFYSATAANARTLTDFLGVNCRLPLAAPAARRRWVALFCILFPVLNVALFILIEDPLLMVLIGAFAQAVTLPILGSAALYLRYRRTDPRLRPGVLWDAFLWLSVLALTIAAAWGVYDAAVRAIDKLKSM